MIFHISDIDVFTTANTESPEFSTYWLCARVGTYPNRIAFNKIGQKRQSGPTQKEYDEFVQEATQYFNDYRALKEKAKEK